MSEPGMVTISKPLSASQAQAYHSKEFTSAEQAYYSQKGEVLGEWQGKLAQEWGLSGKATEEEFQRLANGQHPLTAEQLVRHRQSFTYKAGSGETVKTMEHRAGWDATFSAPKSVSLTALVGNDERVRDAHVESVRVALDEMERFVQAHMGGSNPEETTGKWVAVKFEHDSARPVDGYAAPQLHTHCVFFNVTVTPDGKAHAIEPRELYRSQKYATAVYQAELGYRLTKLGYEIEPGKNGAPEIMGYTKEYLEANSLRSQQIRAHLEREGLEGAGAAQIAAHRTRDAKSPLSASEMLERQRELAAAFGNQPARVVERARVRTQEEIPKADQESKRAHEAVTYSRDRHIEREATVGERELMRDALRRAMGNATFHEVRANLESRLQAGEFVDVSRQGAGATRTLTTREMLELERDNIAQMQAGQGRCGPMASEPPIGSEAFDRLSIRQREAVEDVLQSRDRIIGLQGAAGTGKTASLAAVREAAQQEGFRVEGFAPTSRAAHQLEEAGISAHTLQHHLARPHAGDCGQRHLFIVDESSLASTKQVNDFLHRLGERDHVIFVGDTRQHQGVEAGRPFEQLQQAGMHTAHLEEIIRQKDPSLKQAVEQLARGEIREAIDNLQKQGRVHEIRDRHERLGAIAKAYAENPQQTLVVSPDNKSRQEINALIHDELQGRGSVAEREERLTVLVPRQELTGADRRWAAQYEAGDIVRYSRGSRTVGIEAGEYGRVTEIDRDKNLLTVQRHEAEELTYDPRRLHGVSVYKEAERDFSQGDRIQFTAPYKEERIANRQLGTVERIDADGNFQIRLDSGRDLEFNLREHPHLDFGYAVTSHSSQGTTADRVLVHVDTEQAHEALINSRLAYVSVSRGRYDAQIYTNDGSNLCEALSKEVSKESALVTYEGGERSESRAGNNETCRDLANSIHRQPQRERDEEQSLGQ